MNELTQDHLASRRWSLTLDPGLPEAVSQSLDLL